MLDLAEGVLNVFAEAQLRAPSKPWGLGPELHWDNRLARLVFWDHYAQTPDSKKEK